MDLSSNVPHGRVGGLQPWSGSVRLTSASREDNVSSSPRSSVAAAFFMWPPTPVRVAGRSTALPGYPATFAVCETVRDRELSLTRARRPDTSAHGNRRTSRPFVAPSLRFVVANAEELGCKGGTQGRDTGTFSRRMKSRPPRNRRAWARDGAVDYYYYDGIAAGAIGGGLRTAKANDLPSDGWRHATRDVQLPALPEEQRQNGYMSPRHSPRSARKPLGGPTTFRGSESPQEGVLCTGPRA